MQPLASTSTTAAPNVQPQQENSIDDQPQPLPSAPNQPLPALKSLLPTPPHPSLRWQLLQLLYGYCLAERVHVGDWDGDEVHAAQMAMAAAPPLWPTPPVPPPSGAQEALSGCMEAAMVPPLAAHTTRAFAVALLEVRVVEVD